MSLPTLDQVCARALALPCSPSLLPRLAEVLANPAADIEDMARLVALDPVLASSTLRLANSAFFSGNAVETVGDAVMRLGARELYRLAALSMTARWAAIDVDGYRWEAGDFCRASLVRAVASETIAESTGKVDPGLAYTCGLVHEIGKLAVAFACSEHFAAIRRHQSERGCTWLEAETAVLGFNHANVSARLLTEWKFPAACIAVAKHNPPGPDMPDADRCMAAHVHAAHVLATAFGAGQGEDAFFFSLDESLLVEWGLSPALIEAQLPKVFDRVTRLLRDRVSVGEIKF